jgi:hypothetical protein
MKLKEQQCCWSTWPKPVSHVLCLCHASAGSVMLPCLLDSYQQLCQHLVPAYTAESVKALLSRVVDMMQKGYAEGCPYR